jgi:hypothetical protein
MPAVRSDRESDYRKRDVLPRSLPRFLLQMHSIEVFYLPLFAALHAPLTSPLSALSLPLQSAPFAP